MPGSAVHPSADQQAPVLAVIIPHFNDLARLRICLDALLPQVPGAGVEVLVVDNDTPGGLAALQAEYPCVRYVIEPEKGAACARNKGVTEAEAPNLLFLDADCVPAAGWLARALELAGADRVVGGRVDTFDETPPPRSGAEAFEEVFAFRMQMYIEKKGFAATANLLTTRRVFDAVGPMVPGLSEDMDWCFRATGAGFPLIYDDAMAVGHPTRRDWPALRRKWRRMTNESFLLNGTSPGNRVWWMVRALAVLGSAAIHVWVVLSASKLRNGAERRRAAGTLVRLRLLRFMWMTKQALGSDTVNR